MKFKPCPFCGSTDIVLATIPAWPTSYYELICADCNVAIHAEDTKSVCALWNRRVEQPNPPLTLGELRQMDGEPVWVVEGKAKYYALIIRLADRRRVYEKNHAGKFGSDLHDVPTCELVKELQKREGVETHTAEPYQDVAISVNGPAVVLVVID